MIVYVLTYIFSCVIAYFYSVEKDKYIAFFLNLCLFATLFLPLALRYDIGTDYINYFEQIAWDINPREGRWGGFELGWRPLLWLIKTFDLDIHYFFVIVAFFSVFFVLKIIGKKYAYFGIVIYVSTLFLDSFSLIRQAFAAIVAIYGLDLYYKKRNKKYISIIFLSCFFHDSMFLLLFFLPFFFFVEKLKPFSKQTIFFLFLGIYAFFTVVNIPKMIFGVVVQSFFGDLSRYFTDELYGGATKLGSGLGVLLKELTVIPFVFFITRSNKNNSKNILFMPSLVIHFFILITYIFSTQITIMNRLPYIFTSYYLISIKVLYNSKSKYRKLGLILLVIIFSMNFIVNLIKNPASAPGGLGITPYQSIFSR